MPIAELRVTVKMQMLVQIVKMAKSVLVERAA